MAAVDALTICAADRITLATATGEIIDLDHAVCWLWLNPDEGTATIHGVVEFMGEFRTAPPVTLDGWTRAIRVGVGLAGYDQGQARLQRFNAARYAAGQQAHGGMRDTPLSVAYQLAGTRPAPALAASM